MTYLGLAGLFLVPPVLLAAVATQRRRLGLRWWARTAVVIVVLLALTVVFDSLMIAADLFRFHAPALAGPTLVRAPVEDLAWPLAAGLALPALWELARPAERPEPAAAP
ncbi:lycopene cyclase domain-containing protein, partial [Georgenia yuyongxinii]